MTEGRRGRNAATRRLTVSVRTAKGRKASSTRWLQRQFNDPYVVEAGRRGYRSRAAFKLIELDDKFRFLKPGSRVVDLGAAPGGWTKVACERVRAAAGPEAGRGRVVAIDLLPMDPIPGAVILHGDFLAPDAPARLREALGGPADVVMTDMAPSTTGHRATDHLRIVALAEAALDFARQVLAPGGVFLAKIFHGGAEAPLLAALRRDFAAVKHVKPKASRRESAEIYLIGLGFRGRAA